VVVVVVVGSLRFDAINERLDYVENVPHDILKVARCKFNSFDLR